MDLSCDKQAELRKIIDNYKNIETFVKENKRPSYVQFDYMVVHGLTLFMIEPDMSFDALEQTLDKILSVLPSIKRIFAQPFIHLRERDVVLPAESVRIINNNTIRHISSHSELWTDIKKDEIKPAKLLTRIYDDDYGIYENLVFCQTVDDVLAFTRSNIRFFRELIYTNQTIEINLLERVNHLNYFLALGKLHIGYSRNFESYYPKAAQCLNKLQFISNSIVPRLKRPVYKHNRLRPSQIRVRKTNILSMHKDYHQIYKLAKYFYADKPAVRAEVTDRDILTLQKNYFYFCEAMCVFAIGNFNFVCDEDKAINFSRLHMTFVFKKWTLTLRKLTLSDEVQVLIMSVTKDKPYTAVILPSIAQDNASGLLRRIKAEISADEYVIFGADENDGDSVLIDITSIESFRRVQQIVLRAMAASDFTRDECPFCSGMLALNEKKSVSGGEVYECVSCRTEIYRARCPETGKDYLYTRIAGLSPNAVSDKDSEWLARRKRESLMYFRNITEITDELEIVCPHCGKTHK